MARYFLEVSYQGANYSGFQVQENANSVQAEVEKAFLIYYRKQVELTGASRTDTGVHALQNFFHFDMEEGVEGRSVYNLNAILPPDISINQIYPVPADAHCRFDAIYREYQYRIYRKKDPFLSDRAFYYPFLLDFGKLGAAAAVVKENRDFTSFSKRNTQAKTPWCTIEESVWTWEEGVGYTYRVRANRFLRGMVRGLVGTMLQVGRGRLSLEEWRSVIGGRDSSRVDFSVPGHGLFLVRVGYPEGLLGEGLC